MEVQKIRGQKVQKVQKKVTERFATPRNPTLRSLYMNENSYFSEKYLVGYFSHGSAICMKFLFL